MNNAQAMIIMMALVAIATTLVYFMLTMLKIEKHLRMLGMWASSKTDFGPFLKTIKGKFGTTDTEEVRRMLEEEDEAD